MCVSTCGEINNLIFNFHLHIHPPPLPLVGPTKARPYRAVFKIIPKMNKFEVKEYLEKIYGIPVKNVMTQNWMGRRKRLMGRFGVVAYKRPDFKKVSCSENKMVVEKQCPTIEPATISYPVPQSFSPQAIITVDAARSHPRQKM